MGSTYRPGYKWGDYPKTPEFRWIFNRVPSRHFSQFLRYPKAALAEG